MTQRLRKIAHPPDKKRRLEKRERKRRQSLDGNGSWRLSEGERRTQDRRDSDGDDSPIIHLPFLDDEWGAEDDNSDTNAQSNNQTSEAKPNVPNTDENKNSSNIQTGAHADDSSSENEITEDIDGLSNEGSQQKLTAAEKARLASLKTMLDASNARYQQASKNRRPVFAAGLEVKVVNGDHAGEIGIVLDADYIANRALISLPEQESPRWIGFRSLGHSD